MRPAILMQNDRTSLPFLATVCVWRDGDKIVGVVVGCAAADGCTLGTERRPIAGRREPSEQRAARGRRYTGAASRGGLGVGLENNVRTREHLIVLLP